MLPIRLGNRYIRIVAVLAPSELGLRHDQLLRSIPIRYKLSLAHVSLLLLLAILLLPRGAPHHVSKLAALLAFLVLVRARRVEAGVVLASRTYVGEAAPLARAIGAVATQRHGRVPEGTAGVGAVGVELAVLLRLVHLLLRRRGVPRGALAVLARGAEWALVCNVDSRTGRGSGRLVCEGAVGLDAFEIEFAERVGRLLFGCVAFNVHACVS